MPCLTQQEECTNTPAHGDSEYVFKHNYSYEEEEALKNIALVYEQEFDKTIFPSKEALKTRLEEVGRRFGVYVSTSASRVFSCNRYRNPKPGKTQARNSTSSLPCNCPMIISSYPDPDNPLGPKRRDAKG
jgi:hypothetical protein